MDVQKECLITKSFKENKEIIQKLEKMIDNKEQAIADINKEIKSLKQQMRHLNNMKRWYEKQFKKFVGQIDNIKNFLYYFSK